MSNHERDLLLAMAELVDQHFDGIRFRAAYKAATQVAVPDADLGIAQKLWGPKVRCKWCNHPVEDHSSSGCVVAGGCPSHCDFNPFAGAAPSDDATMTTASVGDSETVVHLPPQEGPIVMNTPRYAPPPVEAPQQEREWRGALAGLLWKHQYYEGRQMAGCSCGEWTGINAPKWQSYDEHVAEQILAALPSESKSLGLGGISEELRERIARRIAILVAARRDAYSEPDGIFWASAYIEDLTAAGLAPKEEES